MRTEDKSSPSPSHRPSEQSVNILSWLGVHVEQNSLTKFPPASLFTLQAPLFFKKLGLTKTLINSVLIYLDFRTKDRKCWRSGCRTCVERNGFLARSRRSSARSTFCPTASKEGVRPFGDSETTLFPPSLTTLLSRGRLQPITSFLPNLATLSYAVHKRLYFMYYSLSS